jgi:hypothetical protein
LGPCLDSGGTYQEEPLSTKHASREWTNASQSYECHHIIQTDRSAVWEDEEEKRVYGNVQEEAPFAEGLGEFDEAKEVVMCLIGEYEAAERDDYLDPDAGKERSEGHEQWFWQVILGKSWCQEGAGRSPARCQMELTASTTHLKIDQPPSIAAFSSSRLSAKTLLATSNGDFDEIDAGRNSDIAEMAWRNEYILCTPGSLLSAQQDAALLVGTRAPVSAEGDLSRSSGNTLIWYQIATLLIWRKPPRNSYRTDLARYFFVSRF